MTHPTNGGDLIGKTIGQYTILEEIGRGGMATVYSAMQSSMNRKVAIKILPRHFLHDPGFLDRFEREVEVISRLEHPHILPIYDYGNADNVPYIAMRYLGGGSMAQMIRRGVPAIRDIEKPFGQVASALDYAHQQGVIHRDLKPGNIMLDEAGNAYLSDFGIARVMGSELTGSAIIGTPAYMSPEQAHGVAIDARSDVYALGIVLFELITGREPYQSETPMGVLLMHVNEPMPSVRDFRDDVPETVEDVILKATAKNPDERYTSAGEVARAFTMAMRGESPISPTERARLDAQRTMPPTRPLANTGGTIIGSPLPATGTGTGTVASPATTTSAGESIQVQRSPVMWVVGVLVLLVIIGGGALLLPNLMGGASPQVTPAVALVPTPFTRAQTVETDLYTISIPQSWMPDLATFNEVNVNAGIRHYWQNAEGTIRVELVVIDLADAASLDFTQAGLQVADVERGFFSISRERLEEAFIDVGVAEDGTVRRSYRFEDLPRNAPGQIDLFYRRLPNGIAILAAYTADSVASDPAVLQTLQLVLDSLRVPPPDIASS